jgi:DNA repair exonuclease SbcCD ATPase subunit
MANEKYLNYYVETLTSTMTDCVIRNISMQANAKITDEVVKEQSEKIDALVKINGDLQNAIKELQETNASNESTTVQELKNKLLESEKLVTKLGNDINESNSKHRTEIDESNSKHRTEIDELISKFRDYDSVKNQAGHVETFKGELVRAREETNQVRSELESKINALASENIGKINALTEQNEKTVAALLKQNEDNVNSLIQKHETEKSEYNNKIDELIAKIDYLQLPPAKRKKIDELNKEVEPTTLTSLIGINGPIKDGGTF